MDLQLALGTVEDNVPEDVKPLWPEVTKTCMMMWRSLDSMLSNFDEAQRGLKVAITEAAKSIGITLDDLRPPYRRRHARGRDTVFASARSSCSSS